MPRVNVNWGPLTREQSLETVTRFLTDASEAVSGDDMAEAIHDALKDDEEARTSLYDRLRQEFEG